MTWTIPPRSDGPAGLALSRAGAGAPVLLIHGVGLRSECWARQIPALAERYGVLAADLPGHGESVAFATVPGLADFADRIAVVLESLSRPALVVGHSLGALIALELATRYPHLVAGVAPLNAIWRRNPDAAAAVRARAESLPEDRVSDPGPTLKRWFEADPDVSAEAACRDWLLSVSPKSYKAAYRSFANADGPSEEALAALGCPGLFMTGALEPNSTPAMSRAMADLAPKGEALVIEGAAHMMPMTHAEEVNTALLDFARTCFGAAS